MLKALLEVLELTLVVACLGVALRLYVQHLRPTWSKPLKRRRLAVGWALVLGVLATKVTEDVLDDESGPIDKALLGMIGARMSHGSTSVFEAITVTGSADVLTPLTVVATLALLAARRRFEAMLLAASTLGAAGVVYVVKTVVGRARPDLWPAQWYWGSSFPSGHTLVVAAFATAAALAAARMWPPARAWAVAAAIVWITLVAISRLALGVHWPTDVLAAACIGASLPLGFSLAFDVKRG
jgi:undecaprenyl-diphosphatase